MRQGKGKGSTRNETREEVRAMFTHVALCC